MPCYGCDQTKRQQYCMSSYQMADSTVLPIISFFIIIIS
ncbi:hypothetical protein OIU77_022709 [Salix suchowensis]|uniref:Uncharacterized protein n=1 Tax=Salix suchowensis TaxID=1278906 RepID=A0ABQ9C173_9ROSI|nr:hypothetical protein OIU77_022709 [Salix suchowensis]